MHKKLFQKIKKLIFFLLLIQQKKIFLIIIGFISLFIVSWNYFSVLNQNNYLNLKKIYDFTDESKIFFFNLKDKILKKQNEIKIVSSSMDFVKSLLKNKKIDDAEKEIMNILKKTKDENIKNILYLRLAKIFLYHKKIEQAIKTLNKIKSYAWWTMKYDILGDALINKGDQKTALLFFNKALSITDNSSLKEIIEIKINNLK